MRIEYPCTLPREEIIVRLRALADYMVNRHKLDVQWNGERAIFTGRVKRIVKVAGQMSMGEGKVVFEGEDPGALWRGQATKYIRGKLDAYLDPSADPATLPRGK